MSNSELMPCPFCGSTPQLMEPNEPMFFGGYVVACQQPSCQAQGRFSGQKDKAIAAWNHRPREDRLQRRLESSYAMLAEATQALKSSEDEIKKLRINEMSNQKDAAVSVMQEYFPNGGCDFDEVCALFDAIAEGKVPGIVVEHNESKGVEHGK